MAKNFTQEGEAVIGGLVSGDTPRHARLDTSTHTLQTIDYAHHEVHSGSHFFYTDKNTVGSGDKQEYVITTPNTTEWAHMLFRATGSAITTVDLYEGTTRTGTTDVVTFNNNRNTTDSASVIVYKGASTDGADGTLIFTIQSGASSQQSRSPLEPTRGEEIILKQNTKYLIRITSGTASNLTNLKLEWYEHTSLT